MAISVLKAHILRKQSSLHQLWPLSVTNGGLRRRRSNEFPLLPLLSHPIHFRSHPLPVHNCSRTPLSTFLPVLRRRLHHLSCSMSSPEADGTSAAGDKTVKVVIKGRVQGVFYRNWTIDNAKELGLKGWVRNRRDGSVEALFSGSPDKVQEMEQLCRRGPPDAIVTGLQVVPCSDDPGPTFERKPTV
ncbi:acylphosphatase [Striga asiatica]|uniref:acylphosphatase n=1 Tax=Striga asiatica TaxID=4170 RepID=A0A5A7PVF8_STRAF|nr:acylphosphatase [Striga asiatica]